MLILVESIQRCLVFKKKLTPSSVRWIGLHIILILMGLLSIHLPILQESLGMETSAAIGISLISTGIAGSILFLYVSSTEGMKKKIEAIQESGIDEIFEHRSVSIKKEYDRRLESARNIDVVGWGLGSFRQDYAKDFAAWSQRCKVRLMVIDPDAPGASSYADLRDAEEGNAAGQTREAVNLLLREIANNQNINAANFSIKLMTSIPSINIMKIDDEIFWGPYLLETQSRNTFTITCKPNGFIYNKLSQQLEKIWSSYSKDPNLDDLLED